MLAITIILAGIGTGFAIVGGAMISDPGNWIDKAGAAGLLVVAGFCGFGAYLLA